MDGNHTIPLEGANKGPSWPSQAAAKHIQQRACYPPGGRAPRDCHGLPPREIFLQMNLESYAPRLGFAQMDSHWRGWQEGLSASSARGVGLLSADMALPVPVPFQRPAPLDLFNIKTTEIRDKERTT